MTATAPILLPPLLALLALAAGGPRAAAAVRVSELAEEEDDPCDAEECVFDKHSGYPCVQHCTREECQATCDYEFPDCPECDGEDKGFWFFCRGYCEGWCDRSECLTDRALPRCFADDSYADARRGLSDGEVIHINPETHSIPRDDVVDAVDAMLAGAESFVLEVDGGTSIHLFDVELGMEDSPHDDLTQAFTATGFVRDEPHLSYTVSCPEEGTGPSCSVVMDEHDASVDCFDEKAGAALDARRLSHCADHEYEVRLFAHGAHHFLLVSRAGGPAGDAACPPNVALDSLRGHKFRAVMFPKDAAALPSHRIGTAPLAALLAAEERAEPLDRAVYGHIRNNCIHYAMRITRDLGFPDTEELAAFLTKNIIEAPGLEGLLQAHAAKPSGNRVLASLANRSKTLLESSIKRIILNQFELKPVQLELK